MNRWIPLLGSVLAGAACNSERGFYQDLLPELESNPPGLENPVKTDVIVQVTTPMVDVLWVMDDSCSMSCITGCHGSLTDEVVENFPKFMQYFEGSGLDYHIGVITTDLDDPNAGGRLEYAGSIKYIELDTPEPEAVFFDMATVGTEGSGKERGLGTSYSAIEVLGDTYNSGYYRPEASLHTTVLANEDDGTPASFVSFDEYVDWYDDLKAEADMRTFNSLVCTVQSDGCNSAGNADWLGTNYLRATEEIGGIVWDLGNSDWAGLLDQLGAQAAGLKREYFLSSLPVASTIEVHVVTPEGAELSFDEAVGDPPVGDWIYDPQRNSITFQEYVPTSLSKIQISYTPAGSAVTGEVIEEVSP
ncbi:MAG: hypothetical protein ABMA64_33155 [Myxococcota bacterium]